jgi:hypothetical protein
MYYIDFSPKPIIKKRENGPLAGYHGFESNENILIRINQWIKKNDCESSIINIETIMVPDRDDVARLLHFRVWLKGLSELENKMDA